MQRKTLLATLIVTVASVLMPLSAAGGRLPAPDPAHSNAVRAFEANGYTRIVAQRQASVEEVATIAAATEGLDHSEALALVMGIPTSSANASDRAFAAPSSVDAVYCQNVDWEHGRGVFPYRRWIVGHTYWCYRYGRDITYRASNTSAYVDGVCSGGNEQDWRVSGGAGYSWVVVHHEASFSCVTPWWYQLNDSLWMRPAFNSWGSTSMTESN